MRRAISSFVAPRAAALTATARLGAAVRLQSGGTYPPHGIPPEMRAPAAADPAARQQPLTSPLDSQAAAAGAGDEFVPPQKPTEAPQFLKMTTSDKGITHLQLAKTPVNSLSLEMLQEFNQWMLWLGSNEETKGIILSSAIPTVFSAGIDLAELYNPQQERLVQFWRAFQELWLILNSFPKPIVGAITGNCPAGGCIIALACDYRVMARAPKGNTNTNRLYRIGLNEAKLGIVAPAWTLPAYAYVLGSRQAERMLQLGETPTADDALKIGLVDHVSENEEEALAVALQHLERFLAVPTQSRWMVRDMMRREYLQMLASDEDRNYDTEFFSQLISSPDVQNNLGNYLNRLKSRVRK